MLLTESAIHRVNFKPTNRRSLCRITPPLRSVDLKIYNSSSVSTHTHAPRFPDQIVSPDVTGLLIGGSEETDGAPSSLK